MITASIESVAVLEAVVSVGVLASIATASAVAPSVVEPDDPVSGIFKAELETLALVPVVSVCWTIVDEVSAVCTSSA